MSRTLSVRPYVHRTTPTRCPGCGQGIGTDQHAYEVAEHGHRLDAPYCSTSCAERRAQELLQRLAVA